MGLRFALLVANRGRKGDVAFIMTYYLRDQTLKCAAKVGRAFLCDVDAKGQMKPILTID